MKVGRLVPRLLHGVIALAVAGAIASWSSPRAEAASCAGTSGIRVAVVVDYGTAIGTPGLTSRCVDVSARASGVEALRAAVGSIATDSSGKICQIGGVPATFDRNNCSAPHNGVVSYWAYFHGTAGGWTYSSVGAGGWRVQRDVVEGWHFVSVAATQQQSAPSPRNFTDGASYRWQSTCPVAPVQTGPAATQPGSAPAPAPAQRPGRAEPPSGPSPGAGTAGTPTTTKPRADATSNGSAASGSSATTTRQPTTTSGDQVSGLRSTETAPRLTKAQVTAAIEATEPSSRPVGAVIAGAGGIAIVAAALGVVTARSRKSRRIDGDPS